MSYLSLARKYRPNRFEDLVGQESVSMALSNGIRLQREAHAVIFTGVRGVGKTTTARIYAKALNCDQGPSPDPCDRCASCLAIQQGAHEDVLEIDGASHTGVDDVRALQETLTYVPQRSRYKIYIIDEVHMLSMSAFNALLKTLEEPPAHVVFIFATTELGKVPETIQSRCQVFHLQKIATHKIYERLVEILNREEVSAEEAAIQWVAKEGRGSLRDALTLLDQVIAVSGGGVTWASVQSMVQTGHAEPIIELLAALLEKRFQHVLGAISRWDQDGLSMSTLVEQLAFACRNAFILKVAGSGQLATELLELEEKDKAALLRIATQSAPMDLNRLFRVLAKCLDDLRNAELDRYIVENYSLEWCLDPGLPDINSLMKTVQQGVQPSSKPAHPLPSSMPANPSVPKEGEGLRERWKKSQSTLALQANAASQAVGRGHSDQPPAQMPEKTPAQPDRLVSITDMQTKVVPDSSKDENTGQNTPGPMAVAIEESASSDANMVMPSDWRSFVEEWKKQKPLQARVLEETYVLEYSPQKIKLAVEASTMAGKKLLHVDTRKKLLAQFEQLFGFKGFFEVVAKDEGASPVPSLGESLLETKQREREVQREHLRKQLEEHPLTREVIRAFDGTIEAIDVQ